MKRIIAIIMGLFLVVSVAYGAGTVVITSDILYPGESGNDEARKITYLVDFDAVTATIGNVVLRDIKNSDGSTANRNEYLLHGWWLLRIDTLYGDTGPTDDTGLYIWSTEDRIDILGDNGADAIDNATDNTIYPKTATPFLTGLEIFDIDGQAVSDASCTLIFHLYR